MNFPVRPLRAQVRSLLGTILFCASSASAIADAATINLDQAWGFYRDDQKTVQSPEQVPPSAWSSVDLPHTARLEARQPKEVWQGTAFYKKSFEAKLGRGERAILRFEAAMNVADVWVNGQHLGQHLGGYLPFAYDITDQLKAAGANEVTVRINNEDNVITGPKPLKILDYIQYGGIYRSVRLIIKPAVHRPGAAGAGLAAVVIACAVRCICRADRKPSARQCADSCRA
jgi:beta-galactosidase